ncbi:MAG TPA: hypothetical protein VLI04_09195 [Nocardioidaceae bacterium]|nr:hypothetical protein [Nocardioidaceae bacterium]
MSRTRLLGLMPLALLLGCSSTIVAAPATPTSKPTESSAALALRAWDEQRAAAYAAGSVGELRSLYVDGSAVGAADVRLLRQYVERGFVIEGMQMQVLALDVLRETQALLRVRVTDRLVGAAARGSVGVLPLPQDSPTTRVVTLRAEGGSWRVASVRAERSGDA